MTQTELEVSNNVNAVVDKASSIIVSNGLESRVATEFVRDLKGHMEKVEGFFRPDIENAHKTHKDLCSKLNNFMAPLRNAEMIVKRKIALFSRAEQERIDKEQAAERARAKVKADEEREALLAKAVKAEEKGDDKKAAELLERSSMVREEVRTVQPTLPQAGVINRMEYEIEVLDKALVPEEYKTVDTALIKRIVKSFKGKTKIPGIKIIEVPDVSIRK